MRSRLLVLGALVGAVAALLPVGTASAATPPKATINCDSRLGWVNTNVTGGAGYLSADMPVQVDFQVFYGSYVTASTASVIPAIGSHRTAAATTGADGSLAVVGYGRGWPIKSDLFYTETLQATITNSAGGELWQGRATCTRDLRTTVTLTCDRTAHTVTAQVAGTGYDKPRLDQVVVAYTISSTSQQSAGDPRFTVVSSGPSISHVVQPDSAGALSDLGYVHQVHSDPDPFYYSETLTVEVVDRVTNVTVGRGATACVYIDQGAA